MNYQTMGRVAHSPHNAARRGGWRLQRYTRGRVDTRTGRPLDENKPIPTGAAIRVEGVYDYERRDEEGQTHRTRVTRDLGRY